MEHRFVVLDLAQMQKHQASSLLWAAALAPLATIPATIPVALLTAVESRLQGQSESLAGLGLAFVVTNMFAVPTAYLCMLTIGLPAAVAAFPLRKRAIPLAALVGLLAGMLVWLPLSRHNTRPFRSAAIMAYYGLVVSGTFVLIFRRRARVSEAA